VRRPEKRGFLAPTIFFLVLAFLWEFSPAFFDIPTYVFPRISDISKAMWHARVTLGQNLLVTTFEALVGFVLGALAGFVAGVCMAEWPVVRRTILPYVVGSNAVPVVAIAPIVVLWFGHGLWSKSVVAAFLCFFPLAVNTFQGLTLYESIYADLFRIYGANRLQFFFKFRIHNAASFLFSGMKLSATYSVIGAVVAEFVGSDSGLGFGMLQATYNLNTPRLYGYLLISCALGILMYGAVGLAERFFLRRRTVWESFD
jgi:NitT/TauT family transport system permease protein